MGGEQRIRAEPTEGREGCTRKAAERGRRLELPGAPESLRILVAHDGPVQVAGPHGEAALAPGDVLIAEPDDGVLEVAAGPCALVGEGVP